MSTERKSPVCAVGVGVVAEFPFQKCIFLCKTAQTRLALYSVIPYINHLKIDWVYIAGNKQILPMLRFIELLSLLFYSLMGRTNFMLDQIQALILFEIMPYGRKETTSIILVL